MLTVYSPGAISKCLANPGNNTLHDASPGKIMHVNSLTSIAISPSPLQGHCSNVVHSSSFSWRGRNQLDIHHSSHHHRLISKKWLVSSVSTLWVIQFYFVLCIGNLIVSNITYSANRMILSLRMMSIVHRVT